MEQEPVASEPGSVPTIVPPPSFDPAPSGFVSPTQPEVPPAQVLITDEDLGSMVDIKEAKVERARAALTKAQTILDQELAGLAALNDARTKIQAGGSVVLSLHS